MAKKLSQKNFIFEYYKQRPNQNVEHEDVVDWATSEWKKQTGNVLRDPDRAIRSLYAEKKLIQIRKGCYRYNPIEPEKRIPQEIFSESQKKEILKLGEYRCVICGVKESEGVKLHVDHIVPMSKGGKATIDNGQVLCSAHNNLKKNYGQTETCKRMYKVLYKQAKNLNDMKMLEFLDDVMEVYDRHGINSHINWKL